ncbi:hypothetical protein Taro_022363 [Colocasia esculenta]|uniref:DYW domain-containing protein n=1 Tax=Colocasia esculenta TaxID=4460 RepID=A0A843V3N1_COLES|nr:hypothetical protein [Colocasia esculenta]
MDFTTLLQSCSSARVLKPLHALLVVSGRSGDVFFSTKLVNIYSRLGDHPSSLLSFEQIARKNVFAWNSMISSHAHFGLFAEAVSCFYLLVTETAVRPDSFTFPATLKACQEAVDGKKVHSWIVKLGLESDLFVSASLIHTYSRFGRMADASKVFCEMPVRDLASWNAMVSGYCQNGDAAQALCVFEEMIGRGFGIDPVTIASILPVCPPLGILPVGLSIHAHVVKHGLDSDIFVSNALINMYAKFGHAGDARQIFDTMVEKDLVSWNSMISAYEQVGEPYSTFGFYHGMKEHGFQPDVLTLVSLASATAQIGDSRNGQSVHGFVLRRNLYSGHIFVGNAIVDMYSKWNDMGSARKFFDSMLAKDVISWNTLINGYSQNGLASEAIDTFHTLEKYEQIVPGQGTLVAVIPAYAHVGSLHQGMRIHGRCIRIGLQTDLFVCTCLIDMYAKCGRLRDAILLFHEVPGKSSIPWNAIIAGHGIHGYGQKALELFQAMEEEGAIPDQVTFISLLSACSHSGLVEQGQNFFHLMHTKYGIEPTRKHYACLVDLLGRAGHLGAAYECIRNMPLKPDASVWGALLGACRIYGNVELGTLAFNGLREIDPENVGYYVLLSNMYAKAGKWKGVDDVRSLVKDRGLRKTPGWTSTEVNNKVHVFFTGNYSHPQSEEIYKKLRDLTAKMKALGYVPDYSFVLQDVEVDEKEHILLSHSERLAIAFGIICMPPKTPISIFKNLRVCGDCHTATKFISRITDREIIVRDSNRFHHFKDGFCSCGDY